MRGSAPDGSLAAKLARPKLENAEEHRKGNRVTLLEFSETLEAAGLASLRRARPRTLQLNVGLRCDLACHHCHVEAGPTRTEAIDAATARRVLEVLECTAARATGRAGGGAQGGRDQVRGRGGGARARGRKVVDTCNLTVLFEPGQEDTASFLASQQVRVVASLPCYTAENVDAQRGRDVFRRSIAALRLLNELGYGQPKSQLALDLVYNPQGPELPPVQSELEERYRKELDDLFGISFHRLLTITNMPIKRFAHSLERDGHTEAYMSLLVNHFNPETVSKLMCRETISVGWDGQLYDCDFNQMLSLPMGGRERTIWELDATAALEGEALEGAAHRIG